MPLTPNDIESQAFAKQLWGYRPSQVDNFLRAAADALSAQILDRDEMGRTVQGLNSELEAFRQKERALLDALTAAERLAEERKLEAKKNAEQILADARRQAEQIVAQTHTEITRLEQQILRLKVERESFEARLSAVIDEHRRLLEIRRQEVGVGDRLQVRTSMPPAIGNAAAPKPPHG